MICTAREDLNSLARSSLTAGSVRRSVEFLSSRILLKNCLARPLQKMAEQALRLRGGDPVPDSDRGGLPDGSSPSPSRALE